jgi:hypothetical protein
MVFASLLALHNYLIKCFFEGGLLCSRERLP